MSGEDYVSERIYALQKELAELKARRGDPLENKIEQHQPKDMCASRQSATDAMRSLIQQTNQRAAGLQSLLDILPGKMPADAEEALWNLVISARRL